MVGNPIQVSRSPILFFAVLPDRCQNACQHKSRIWIMTLFMNIPLSNRIQEHSAEDAFTEVCTRRKRHSHQCRCERMSEHFWKRRGSILQPCIGLLAPKQRIRYMPRKETSFESPMHWHRGSVNRVLLFALVCSMQEEKKCLHTHIQNSKEQVLAKGKPIVKTVDDALSQF